MFAKPAGQLLKHVVVGAIPLKVDVLRHPVVQSSPQPAGLVFRRQVPPLPKVHEEAVGFIGLALCQLVLFRLSGLFFSPLGYRLSLLSAVLLLAIAFGLAEPAMDLFRLALYRLLRLVPAAFQFFPLLFELLFPGNGRLDPLLQVGPGLLELFQQLEDGLIGFIQPGD